MSNINPVFFVCNVLKQFPDAEITFALGDDVRSTFYTNTWLRIFLYSQSKCPIFLAVVIFTLTMSEARPSFKVSLQGVMPFSL